MFFCSLHSRICLFTVSSTYKRTLPEHYVTGSKSPLILPNSKMQPLFFVTSAMHLHHSNLVQNICSCLNVICLHTILITLRLTGTYSTAMHSSPQVNDHILHPHTHQLYTNIFKKIHMNMSLTK